jgi:hypothetical protein
VSLVTVIHKYFEAQQIHSGTNSLILVTLCLGSLISSSLIYDFSAFFFKTEFGAPNQIEDSFFDFVRCQGRIQVCLPIL